MAPGTNRIQPGMARHFLCASLMGTMDAGSKTRLFLYPALPITVTGDFSLCLLQPLQPQLERERKLPKATGLFNRE